MSRQEKTITKKLGRPATGLGQMLGVRVQPPQLAELDAWIKRQPEPKPSRPEAIRRLMQAALDAGVTPPYESPLEAGRTAKRQNADNQTERVQAELEKNITAVKRRLAIPDTEKTPSPGKGMEMLRRGHSENELRSLRGKRTFTKPPKKPKA